MKRKHPPRIAVSRVAVPFDPAKEQWRPYRSGSVEYEISNYGRVRRYLRPFLVKGFKYPQVYMSGDKRLYVHVLVARCFIGDRPPGLVVNHKDGNSMNNWHENLEYITQRDNILHARSHGLIKPRGPDTYKRNLTTKEDRFRIVELVNQGQAPSQVARKFGVTKEFVYWLRKHPIYGIGRLQ